MESQSDTPITLAGAFQALAASDALRPSETVIAEAQAEQPEDVALATPTFVADGPANFGESVADAFASLDAKFTAKCDELNEAKRRIAELEGELHSRVNPESYAEITESLTGGLTHFVKMLIRDELEKFLQTNRFESEVADIVDGKLEDYDPTQHWRFSREVENQIDDYDFSTVVQDAINDSDFSELVRDAVQSLSFRIEID